MYPYSSSNGVALKIIPSASLIIRQEEVLSGKGVTVVTADDDDEPRQLYLKQHQKMSQLLEMIRILLRCCGTT